MNGLKELSSVVSGWFIEAMNKDAAKFSAIERQAAAVDLSKFLDDMSSETMLRASGASVAKCVEKAYIATTAIMVIAADGREPVTCSLMLLLPWSGTDEAKQTYTETIVPVVESILKMVITEFKRK